MSILFTLMSRLLSARTASLSCVGDGTSLSQISCLEEEGSSPATVPTHCELECDLLLHIDVFPAKTGLEVGTCHGY